MLNEPKSTSIIVSNYSIFFCMQTASFLSKEENPKNGIEKQQGFGFQNRS